MFISGLVTPLLKPHFDLKKTIILALRNNGKKLKNGDVIVVSSKIVAVSQGRIVELKTVKPGRVAQKRATTHYGLGKEDPRVVELVLQEADAVVAGRMLLTLKDGCLIPSAGIDLSNAPKDTAILWPHKTEKVAHTLWKTLRTYYKIKDLGVIIGDSHCQPLRMGTTGLAIAWAGFEGVQDERGKLDLFGKPLKVTRKAVADNLTSSALVVMGEAAERVPFVLIRGAPVRFTSKKQHARDAYVPADECIFEGLYKKSAITTLTKKPHRSVE